MPQLDNYNSPEVLTSYSAFLRLIKDWIERVFTLTLYRLSLLSIGI